MTRTHFTRSSNARTYDRCPSHDVKIIIGDLNAQVGQEEEFRPTIGKFSAHQQTNENGLRLIDFTASKNMVIRSTFFQHSLPYRYTWRSPQQTESQIDHVLIDGRHFSDIIDVRIYRGANFDSDHYISGEVQTAPKTLRHQQCTVPATATVQPRATKTTGCRLSIRAKSRGRVARRGRARSGPSRGLLEYSESSHQRRSREHHRVRGTESTERMVRRRVQNAFGGEERSEGGNAAARVPTERGTLQIEAETADPPFSGEKAPPGRSGV